MARNVRPPVVQTVAVLCLLCFLVSLVFLNLSQIVGTQQKVIGVLASVFCAGTSYYFSGTMRVEGKIGASEANALFVRAGGAFAVFAFVMWWWLL